MSETSSIEWTRSTFNPWWGCTKISPGCDNCYAERDAHRWGTQWGQDAERRFFGDKHWNEPLNWNRKAAAEQAIDPNAQWRVFCASMADVFDKAVPQDVRERLWDLIDATPNLTWLILTKRIGNLGGMIPDRWSVTLPPNVWIGISVVNQEEADRDIPKLLRVKAHCRWLSMEPLLGAVDLSQSVGCVGRCSHEHCTPLDLDWVVVGGESGPNARPMRADWARSIRGQCSTAGIQFLFKQWGEWMDADQDECDTGGSPRDWIWSDGETYHYSDGQRGGVSLMRRMGKKRTGRLLDGELHDGYPVVRP